MGLALRARFRSRDGTMHGERQIHHLPARFGRNDVNDCVLAHPYVSDFHAVVDLVDGQLCVRDLNSRNGMFAGNMIRLPSQTPVPLQQIAHTFVLGRAVEVQVEAFDDRREIGARSSIAHGSVLGNRQALESGPAWPPGPGASGYGPPGAMSGVPALPPLSMSDAGAPPRDAGGRPPSHAPQGPPSQLPQSLGGSLPPLPRPDAYSSAGYSVRPPDPRDLGGPPRSRPPPMADGLAQSQHLTMSIETMALIGLRELAGSLLPGGKLETTGDVARLVTKLHDLIEAFCRLFIPLRDAVLGPRVRARMVVVGSRSQADVQHANTPAALAKALLDWRNQDYDGAETVERILTEILVQHTASLEDLAGRVARVLDEVAPERIESALKEDGAVGAVFGRHRALWQAYRERFDQLSDPEQLAKLLVADSNGQRTNDPDRRR